MLHAAKKGKLSILYNQQRCYPCRQKAEKKSSTVFKIRLKKFYLEIRKKKKVKKVKASKEKEAGKVQRQDAKVNLTVVGSLFIKHR